MIEYRLVDVGRSKYTGIVKARSPKKGDVVRAVLPEAEKYLISSVVELECDVKDGEVEGGTVLVGGWRPVGRFERVKP